MVIRRPQKKDDVRVDEDVADTNQNALCDAVENNDEAKVIQLLKQGYTCHPNTQNKLTCLHIACQRGYLGIVCALLDYRFNIHDRTKEYKTPLHEAVCRGHVSVARELLQRGAPTEVIDIISFTPLFVAAQNGDKQMVKTLLEFNAKVEAKDAIGQSPLHAARASNVINILAQKGLDIDIKGDHGNTPLHCASQDFDEQLIKTLLDLGADPTIKNKDGKTPRDLAEPQTWKDDKTALKLLRKAERRFSPELPSDSDDHKNKTEKSRDSSPPTVVDLKKHDKVSEQQLQTPRTSGNSKQTKETDKKARPECNKMNSTHQTDSYKQDKTNTDRCLRDISDHEMGEIARILDKKQAKRLRRLVPKAWKHCIEEDEKGNCRNEYFQLLRIARCRNREMTFEQFKKRIALTKTVQMSHQERICMETELEQRQLTKIRITNLRLITVLSLVASKDYYLLGIELGLSSEAMDEIHALSQELLKERCHQTLCKTKERFPRKTCADVVRAIANLGHDYHKAIELLEQSEHYPIRYR